MQGRIAKSGGPELARELERRGYGWVEAEAAAASAAASA
jgi:Fe-S cluster assembly ATP-binding protein